MINQTRTLLLNKPALYFAGVTGSEYIPLDFAPVNYNAAMQKVHDVLFPQGLDKFSQNYVVAAILKILHCPELEGYTLYPDSRTTYTGSNTDLAQIVDSPASLVFENFGSDVEPHYKISNGSYPQELAVAGEHEWVFTYLDSVNVSVKHNRQALAETYRMANGSTQSNMVALIPNYLTAYFTLPSRQLTRTFTVTYGLTLAPPYNIADKLIELQQTIYQGGTFEALFSPVAGYTDQLTQLRDTWASSVEVTLRFGALVLAYVYYCDSVRQGLRNA